MVQATTYINQTNLVESQLIISCIEGDKKAQKLFYDRFAPKMLGVCIRYVKQHHTAEDILIEGFFKAFKNLNKFQGKGSLEGWIRRIMVNESLMYLRKQKMRFQEIEQVFHLHDDTPSIHEELEANEVIELIQELPTGYRTVFNLYVIEGYKHKEIAELLGISINTSKSQLIQARKRLQESVRQKESDYLNKEKS